jgi:hypothetical protein
MLTELVGHWTRWHREQIELCEQIERFAERLPVHDIEARRSVVGRINATLGAAHAFEENELFPVLSTRSLQIRALLKDFESHHEKDRELAAATIGTLEDISGLDGAGWKELKLLCTALAEGLRRHVQFERAICMALFASQKPDVKRAVQ